MKDMILDFQINHAYEKLISDVQKEINTSYQIRKELEEMQNRLEAIRKEIELLRTSR